MQSWANVLRDEGAHHSSYGIGRDTFENALVESNGHSKGRFCKRREVFKVQRSKGIRENFVRKCCRIVTPRGYQNSFEVTITTQRLPIPQQANNNSHLPVPGAPPIKTSLGLSCAPFGENTNERVLMAASASTGDSGPVRRSRRDGNRRVMVVIEKKK
jgi:hypothetical protein